MVARHIKAELLVQIDKIRRENCMVFVLGATDTPWRLDPATLSCFEQRVYTALPDLGARTKKFKTAFKPTDCDLMPADYRVLRELSEGYTGNDISTIIQDALLQPVRELSSATHFQKVIISFFLTSPPHSSPSFPFAHKAQVISDSRALFIPCFPVSHGGIEMDVTDVDSESLIARPARLRDFVRAVKASRRTVPVDDNESFEKWTLTA